MGKARRVFVCRQCGAAQTKWAGRCGECGTWDSLDAQDLGTDRHDTRAAMAEQFARAPTSGGPPREALPIAQIDETGDGTRRLDTGIGELDRVLGGGLVPGSAVLLGGDPGIGKSTIMLQAAGALASRGGRVLYVSSEESAAQVRLRAARLGLADATGLFVLSDTNLSRIVEQAGRVLADAASAGGRSGVLVIDSVQMVYQPEMDALPGSLTQLRRCCAELVHLAKATDVAVVLVGHVTKEGELAGPRLLEHLVDAVLYFEGDRYHAHRVIRAVKNRFGTTLEVGLFEMTGGGLREVGDPAGVLRAGGLAGSRPGSVICPVVTGTRCMLVEVQALTATGFLGAAKRKCAGLDPNRLAMLIAVLEQHAGLRLADMDVFASSVGGLRVGEPAADLALLLAVAGAHARRALPAGTAAVGEVGLGGEVRPVSSLEQRLREAARLGLTRVLVPAGAGRERPGAQVPGVEAVPVRDAGQAIADLA